jgi:hypothetical protein
MGGRKRCRRRLPLIRRITQDTIITLAPGNTLATMSRRSGAAFGGACS